MHALEGMGLFQTQVQELFSSYPLTPQAGKETHPGLLMQQPLLPSASTSLQQLLLFHQQQQQQQQQQQETIDAAALAAYLLSQSQQLPCSTATALQSTWQQPALCRDPGAAQWHSQPVSSGLLYSNPQLAGLNDVIAAATAAPFSPPGHWQQQQQQLHLQQLQLQVTGSQALGLTSTQQPSLAHNHQFSLGALGNHGSTNIPSYSSGMRASACSFPMPLSCDFNSSYRSCGNTGTAAASNLPAAAADPAHLDLLLSSLSLTHRHINGSLASSLASSSPSRTSILLHGSSGSVTSSSSSSSSSPSTGSRSSEAPAAAVVIAAATAGCDSSSSDVSAQQLLDDDEEGPVVHNHFCRQDISVALNAAVTVLLNTLRSRQYAAENPYPKQRRLYVCGLRESCKAIKCGTALAVLLAPDIQLGNFGKPDRALDGRMREIILSSQAPPPGRACVPVVFALTRKKIGQVFGSKKRMSAITLLDVAGVEELFGAVLQLAEEGRQRWMQMCSLCKP